MQAHFNGLLCCLLLLCLGVVSEAANQDVIVLAVTSCGKKAKFHLPAFLQSLLQQPPATRRRIRLYLFGDAETHAAYVGDPVDCISSRLAPALHSVIFTNITDYSAKWGGLSLLSKYWAEDKDRYTCAAFKLDILSMVPPSERHVVYLDVDVVVFSDLAQLQDLFALHQDKTLMVARESYRTGTGWYVKARNHKGGKTHYHQPTGVNSGLMLMNLDRMRRDNLTAEGFLVYNDEPISMGDQDVINSYAFHRPDEVLILPCEYNRRSDSHCDDGDLLLNGNGTGAALPALLRADESRANYVATRSGILHASRRVFMRHRMYPALYNLHRNLTDRFFQTCNLSHLLVSRPLGASVYIQ